MNQAKKFYLVDDDDDDRFLLREALKLISSQITIIVATNGEHFFEVVENSDLNFPALIVLDVNMPRMNGLGTINRIKSEPFLVSVPVIMYSTSSDPEIIRLASEAGIADFITKPTTFEGFIEFAVQIKTFLQ